MHCFSQQVTLSPWDEHMSRKGDGRYQTNNLHLFRMMRSPSIIAHFPHANNLCWRYSYYISINANFISYLLVILDTNEHLIPTTHIKKHFQMLQMMILPNEFNLWRCSCSFYNLDTTSDIGHNDHQSTSYYAYSHSWCPLPWSFELGNCV
jgi:hypothetical protein